MSSLAAYRARIGAHSGVADATIETALEDAVSAHTAAAFGSQYLRAMVFYAAHLVQLDLDAQSAFEAGVSTTGPVTARKTGNRSETYQKAAKDDSREYLKWVNSTPYGRQYWSIVRTRKATFGRFVTVM